MVYTAGMREEGDTLIPTLKLPATASPWVKLSIMLANRFNQPQVYRHYIINCMHIAMDISNGFINMVGE